MNGNSLGVGFSGALAGAERSAGERSEPQRSAAPAKAVSWRRERQAGSLEALAPRKRGRKSERNPPVEENEKLRRQVGQLTEKLGKAEIIIDVPPKVAVLLGRPVPDPEEKP